MSGISGKDLLQRNRGNRMSNANTLISVVIISKNSKNTVHRCLDSILSQDYSDMEIIVIESSDDGTNKIIEEYQRTSEFPFRIIYQKPKGVAAARNAGILNAHGEVVVFVDTDCWISPNFIMEMARRYAKSDKILCVRTKEVIARPTGIFPRLVDLYDRIMVSSKIPDKFKGLNPLMPRKKLYEIVGLYDENLKSGEDAELYNRVVKIFDDLKKQGYKFEYIPNVTISEEKQGLGFFEYYTRCIWYGEPLANSRYFKSNISANTVKLIIITYFTVLPVFLLVSFTIHLNLIFIAISLIPFILIYLHILVRSIKIKEFSLILFLMPILMFYKNVWLFVGFVKGLMK